MANKTTPTTTDSEDAILDAMIAQAKVEADVKAGSVVNRPDGDTPFPMVVGGIENGGTEDAYVIYDTMTGEPSLCPRYEQLIKSKLKEKRQDGLPRWSLTDPGFRPPVGDLNCRLHSSDPDREKWDGMGLPVCGKEGFFTDWDRERHMRMKHKDEFGRMEEMRMRAEREEERAFQRLLMEKLTEKASG